MQNIKNEEILRRFGDNVRRLRLAQGKTQEELGEDAGISQVQIARIEGGKINTTISTASRILKALGTDANSLFDS